MHDTFTRAELLDAGWTGHGLTEAVARGTLLRIRRGHYAAPGVDPQVERAVRVGGRLACASELRALGAWVPEHPVVHVHVEANAARLRHPDDSKQRLPEGAACVLHWAPLHEPGGASVSHVSPLDATLQAMQCLERRLAIAALDSAVRSGLVRLSVVRDAAAGLPVRSRRLLTEVDARAESGLESIVRTIALDLGFRVALQEGVRSVGRVDLVIEDWIVIETDGDEFHDVTVTPKDRRRDAMLAADGRVTLRFRYAQVLFAQREVARAIIGTVRTHRRIHNSGRLADRALRRMQSLTLT